MYWFDDEPYGVAWLPDCCWAAIALENHGINGVWFKFAKCASCCVLPDACGLKAEITDWLSYLTTKENSSNDARHRKSSIRTIAVEWSYNHSLESCSRVDPFRNVQVPAAAVVEAFGIGLDNWKKKNQRQIVPISMPVSITVAAIVAVVGRVRWVAVAVVDCCSAFVDRILEP